MSRLVTYSVVGLMSLFGGVALAQSPEPIQVDIGAQSVGDALNQFAEQSGLQVVLYADDAKGIDVAGVSGQFDDATVALDSLLASTGLEYSFINDRTVAVASVQKVAEEEGGDSDSGNGRTAGARQRPVMMAQAAPEQSQTSRGTATDSDKDEVKRPLEEIIVTGTSIRGIAPESSPVQSYDREDIRSSGASTTEQFIRTLPQNFGGGATEQAPVGFPNDLSSSSNFTFGTGANLRGLGTGGTLTLLNGNRLAPTSSVGGFVDLSMLPLSAIERIEVLTDGASSIYGSDAVAGVVNFILRDDFEGSETSVRYGTVTDGNMDEYQVSQTLGTNWGSGNILATYEFFSRDNLLLSDRPNIGVPNLTSGDPIPSDVFDLLPKQKRHSAVLSGKQAIGDEMELSFSGLYSRKNITSSNVTASSTNIVDRGESISEALAFNVGAKYGISETWTTSLSGSYSEISNDKTNQQIVASTTGNPVMSTTDSDLWTADLSLTGDLLLLPGGRAKAAFGGHFRHESFFFETSGTAVSATDRDVAAIYGELFIPIVGATNSSPGLQRLEVNLSARADDFSDFGSSVNPKVGVLWSPADGLNLRGSFSTSFAPPPLGRVGDLTRVGIIGDFAYQMNTFFGIDPDPSLVGTDFFYIAGTDADLGPEDSTTFTAGIDYEFASGRHDFAFRSTYYDVNFEGRLGTTPIPQSQSYTLAPIIAFSDPSAFPEGSVVFFPSDDEVQAALDTLTMPVRLIFGSTGIDNVGVINKVNLVRNLAAVETRGLDVDFDYRLNLEGGALIAGVNASYIIEFAQRAAETTPFVETVSTLYNPVDFQMRANIGYVTGGFAGSIFVNYRNSYRSDDTDAAVSINSWTTIDSTLSYEFEQSDSWLSDAALTLSVINLFDKDPPSAPDSGRDKITGYDPANASPLGRFVAIGIRKSF